jgi:hypothetical protein
MRPSRASGVCTVACTCVWKGNMAPAGADVGRKQELVWDGDVERNTATARRRSCDEADHASPPKALELMEESSVLPTLLPRPSLE